MKLLLNNRLIEINLSAEVTVLEFVRSEGLTGTKEGCASGDCGACTVMIGEDCDGSVSYRSANACIMPVGHLAGKHLLTVEGLSTKAALHPVQEAMVECHASQCGYCTPGFVMSLAALVEQGAPQDRDSVLQGISGNLCRCTGYRPIVEAGLVALRKGQASPQTAELPDPGESASFLKPATEAELQLMMRAHPEARLVAGGTDLMLEVTQLYRDIPLMIDLSEVEELRTLEQRETDLVIGSALAYSRLEESDFSTELNSLLGRLGSRQIRNSGTIGGNLANGSPIADTPPLLLAWDAKLELVSNEGAIRYVALSDFYLGYRQTVLGPDEYIARIHVPLTQRETFHRFYKSTKRIEDDISSVMGAFSFAGDNGKIESARVAFGGMAATPVRLQAIEQALAGQTIDDELISTTREMLDSEMTPLSDVRASAAYRMEMARSMLERAMRAFQGEELKLVTEIELHD